MGKTIIAPIIGFIIVVLNMVFGIEIPDAVANDLVDAVVNILSVGLIFYGIIKNHNKKEKKDS